MSKVFFMNDGDFDPRSMITAGVSAKENDTAVGFFGTGFKYAIAIILRLGGTIEISTLSGHYKFTAKEEQIRGKSFNLVYVNDREAGFTTHLGINWEPWMAFRELYCNATDEGGTASTEIDSNYDTVIAVDCGEIYKSFLSKDNYFISGTPLFSSSRVDIYPAGRPFIYYRGIAVRNAIDGQLFSYNVKSHVTLTEDRTAKHDHEIFWPIQKTYQNDCDDRAMLRKVVAYGEHGEAKIGFDKDWGASDTFLEVCDDLISSDMGVCASAREVAKSARPERETLPEFELTTTQQKMMDKAIKHLKGIGVDAHMFEIKTVHGLGSGVMGQARDGVIYLSEAPFNQGTKQLASTILEEWVHNKYGCEDFDRQMQNWLFDKILSLSEEINGEPL